MEVFQIVVFGVLYNEKCRRVPTSAILAKHDVQNDFRGPCVGLRLPPCGDGDVLDRTLLVQSGRNSLGAEAVPG